MTILGSFENSRNFKSDESVKKTQTKLQSGSETGE